MQSASAAMQSHLRSMRPAARVQQRHGSAMSGMRCLMPAVGALPARTVPALHSAAAASVQPAPCGMARNSVRMCAATVTPDAADQEPTDLNTL